MVPPDGKVLVPEGGPSMNGDCVAPCRMLFQSGTDSRSCITRSIPASALKRASVESR